VSETRDRLWLRENVPCRSAWVQGVVEQSVLVDVEPLVPAPVAPKLPVDKTFRVYDQDQPMLLPPDLRDWLASGHPARMMTEGERAQERPQRGRRPHPGEQPTHRAVPQQRHAIERVSAGDHPRDQAQDLQVGVAATRLVDLDVGRDELLTPGSLGQLQDRRKAGARNEFGSSNMAVTS